MIIPTNVQWNIEQTHTGKFILNNKHDAGIYSSTLAAYFGVVEAVKANILIDKINFIKSHSMFKSSPNQDLYPVLFVPDSNQSTLPSTSYSNITSSVIGEDLYANLDYKVYNTITKRFFNSSEVVKKRMNDFIINYDINPSNTIGILYRGTDRAYENKNPEYYITLAQQILSNKPNYDILIQTDQQQFIDLCKAAFNKSRIITIEELPRSLTYDNLNEIYSQAIDRTQWSINLDAAIRIISQSNILINHNGSVAFMACLYRGYAHNMYMFNKHSQLLTPPTTS